MWYVIEKQSVLPISSGYDFLTIAEAERLRMIEMYKKTFPDIDENFSDRLDVAFFREADSIQSSSYATDLSIAVTY